MQLRNDGFFISELLKLIMSVCNFQTRWRISWAQRNHVFSSQLFRISVVTIWYHPLLFQDLYRTMLIKPSVLHEAMVTFNSNPVFYHQLLCKYFIESSTILTYHPSFLISCFTCCLLILPGTAHFLVISTIAKNQITITYLIFLLTVFSSLSNICFVLDTT